MGGTPKVVRTTEGFARTTARRLLWGVALAALGAFMAACVGELPRPPEVAPPGLVGPPQHREASPQGPESRGMLGRWRARHPGVADGIVMAVLASALFSVGSGHYHAPPTANPTLCSANCPPIPPMPSCTLNPSASGCTTLTGLARP
jgi:hypothetical protein